VNSADLLMQQSRHNVRRVQRKLYSWARQEPSRQFDDLHNLVVSGDCLLVAYADVRSKGTPGIDGVDRAWVEKYGRERFLADLRHKLKTAGWSPAPLRRVRVPKASGGFRQIGVPTLADRVIERAHYSILAPLFDPLLSPSCFAYRPRRGTHRALDALKARLRGGSCSVVTTDIASFFDSLEHARLVADFEARVGDKKLRRHFRKYLHRTFLKAPAPSRGVTQGAAMSSLFSNFYLRPLVSWAEAYPGVRGVLQYADDLLFLTEADPDALLVDVRASLASLGLELADHKTVITTTTEGVDYLGHFVKTTPDGRVVFRPSAARVAKLESRLRDAVGRAHAAGNLKQEVTDKTSPLRRLIDGWTNYFRPQQTAEQIAQETLTTVCRATDPDWDSQDR
jgi:RNA-directed DNA polymerase